MTLTSPRGVEHTIKVPVDIHPGPGGLDRTFGTDGYLTLDAAQGHSLRFAADGKMLLLARGAANAIAPSDTRSRTSPAAHSCTSTPESRGTPPDASHACALPSVGCPAKGSSRRGVKIRSR